MGNESELSIIVRARDEASRVLNNIRGQLGTGLGGAMREARAGSQALATGLVAAGAAVVGLGAAGVTSAGQFEQSRVAFEVMLGSADRARKMMEDIAEFAKSTPFELPEVVAGSKKLIAYGFAQEQVIKTMRMIGDVSSGVGANLGELTDIYGKARTQGTLFTEDFDQFTGRGIPLAQALSGVLGVSADKVRGLASEGKITFDVLEKGFTEMTKEGGQFGGMMDKQSKTFSGVVSNIKDGFGQFLRTMVGISSAGDIVKGGLFDKIKQGAEAIMPLVQRLPEILSAGFDKIKPYIPQIAGAIMIMLVPAFFALAGGIISAMAPLIPFLALGALLGTLANNLAKRMGGWGAVLERVKGWFENAMLGIKVFIQAFKDPDVTSDGWVGTVEKIASSVRGAFDGMMAAASAMWQGIQAAVKFLLPSLQALWEAFATRLLPSLMNLWNVIQPYILPTLKVLAMVIGGVLVAALWIAINVLNVIISVISWFANVLSGIIQVVAFVVTGIINYIQFLYNFWSAIFTAIYEVVKFVFQLIAIVVATAISLIMAVVQPIANALSGPFRTAVDWIKGVWGGISGWFSSVVGSIRGALSGVTDAITAPFSRAWDWITGLPGRIVSKIGDIGALLKRTIGDWDIPGPLGKVRDVIPGFADGGFTGRGARNEVAGLVHRGEYVVPRQYVDQSSGMPKVAASGKTENHFHGTIVLGNAAAVDRFFQQLDQDSILVGNGMTPNRGSY